MGSGEAPAEAVVREVNEETGLSVRAERVLGIYGGREYRFTYPNGDQVEYLVVLFECVRLSGELIQSNEETEFLRWFSVDEVPELAVPYPKEALVGQDAPADFQWNEAWLKG